MRRRFFITATYCAVLLGISLVPGHGVGAEETSSEAQEQKAEQRRPIITVSQETTHILEPLDEAGYVDYLAALNQMSSAGVTTENNAAVLFVRALGLNTFEQEQRDRYFELLGIESLPRKGTYLLDFHTFAEDVMGRPLSEQEEREYDAARERPWSTQDSSLISFWLVANEKPLQLIVAGTRRPRCYFPLVATAEAQTMVMVLLPSIQDSRAAARMLKSRAMLRLHEGNVDAAWQDLLACHRLGRLVGKHPMVIGALVSIAIDSIATQGDFAMMQRGGLSARQALQFQQDLRKLPPLPVMADKIGVQERFTILDVLTKIARQGPAVLDEAMVDGVSFEMMNTIKKLASNALIDWDLVLQIGNKWFDRLDNAARQPTVAERVQEFAILENELSNFREQMTEPGKLLGSFFQDRSPRKTVSRYLGNTFLALITPDFSQACEAENRGRTRTDLAQLGFALAAFHADHKKYPPSLEELAPRYISKVPRDLYTEQPLRYTCDDNGFLLYSVGKNRTDDGGKTFDSTPNGDDIVLRISRGPDEKQ